MTYRFQWQGVPQAEIQDNIPVGITATVVGVVPLTTMDISLSDDAGADDLKEFMGTKAWTFILAF